MTRLKPFFITLLILTLSIGSIVMFQVFMNADIQNSEQQSVLKGKSAAQIMREYTNENRKSSAKGFDYLVSIQNTEVVWVATVTEVEQRFLATGSDIKADVNGYPILIVDEQNKYRDLNVGDKIQIEGKIESYTEFMGFEFLNPEIKKIAQAGAE